MTEPSSAAKPQPNPQPPDDLAATSNPNLPGLDPMAQDSPKVGLPRPWSGLSLGMGRGDRPANRNSSTWDLVTGIATVLLVIGLFLHNSWIGLPAAVVVLWLSLRVIWPPLSVALQAWISVRNQQLLLAGLLATVAVLALVRFTGLARLLLGERKINWEAFGALAEGFGAVGQISVAFLALYVAWRQYVISKELTMQQNRITQQQTIDAYFQGISDLVINEEGLLEDWPPERAIAEGRTAAILSGLDGEGKAKVIRFLSSSKLLTPLKRDRRLGRPIFDGLGGYEEDLDYGVRVIDLVSMLAYGDLSGTDLRRTEMSEANLVHANLRGCDLGRANLSRAILFGSNLTQTDLTRTRLFHGPVATASPRNRLNPPNYATGAQTGAVIENADFTRAKGLSEEQRYYCCAWGGPKTRMTIPGGCEGIPNQLVAADQI